MNKKFYKYAGFWWTYPEVIREPHTSDIKGPYCLNCQTDLEFPDDAYIEDPGREDDWLFDTKWKGNLICPLCQKNHKWIGGKLWDLQTKISMILISNYRSSLDKISLEEPLTQVKVRDQDDKYFLAAKVGQKDGKRVGVVYFGEKSKDQNKKDYSQIFIDLDDEQLRFDKSNKHPKDILAKMKVEFPKTTSESTFGVKKSKNEK